MKFTTASESAREKEAPEACEGTEESGDQPAPEEAKA